MPNRFPDDQTPDDATPDNATPDGSSSKGSSSSNKSPPPPPSSNKSPPPPSSHPPSPPSSSQASSHKSPPPPSSNQASSHKSPSSNQSPSHKSPPPPPPSGENSSTNENNGNDDMTWIGVGVGAGFFLLLLICICLICSRRKKNKQKYYYSADPSQGTDYLFATQHRDNTSQYGSYRHHSGQHPHPNWQAGPGPYGGPPSGVWSGPHPLNSGEMSSNYTLGMGPPPPPGLSLNLMGGSGTFTYEELAAATGGFARENIIGQGGFGFVHKGVLASGKEVAVKGLKAGSGQGEREFQAEIEIISRVHHRHLVTLVGYCIAGGQRMLVYEFVPNNTLEHHLHGKGVPTMDWATRMKIAIGSAKGLAYLHEDCSPRIIHRDIKASNVLIDNSFEAKVADFGLAKLTTDTNTHVSTRVMGTFGYLAPEYAASGKLSEKSDVFSFGVMLLELITGKRPIDLTNTMDESLVDWARPLLSQALEVEGNFKELVDPFLEGNYNPLEMAKMAACASASIRHSARKRPKMSQIVKILEGDVTFDDLKEGMLKPSGQSSSYSSNVGGSDQYDTKQYDADMIKFKQAIMSSQEFGNSS